MLNAKIRKKERNFRFYLFLTKIKFFSAIIREKQGMTPGGVIRFFNLKPFLLDLLDDLICNKYSILFNDDEGVFCDLLFE